MKVNIADAILALEPTAQFSVTSEDLDKIEWFSDGVTQPSKSAIQTKLDELQAVEDANQYQRDRAVEYPNIADQLDMLWHAIEDGDFTNTKMKNTDFYTKLKEVKDDNPKG